mmetsp:Transcript_23803/g.42884  ORF Transcript_23803/g.42884 Transcript_23803/m.42884 type:complete len:420 (+) Transcript_23803:890-2149(+)
MICCGVPRTLPSGPELSNTRLTTLPPPVLLLRLRLFLDRDRDLEDFMKSVQLSGIVLLIALWCISWHHPHNTRRSIGRRPYAGQHAIAPGLRMNKHGLDGRTSPNSAFARLLSHSCGILRNNNPVAPVQIRQNPHQTPALAGKNAPYVRTLFMANLAEHTTARRQITARLGGNDAIGRQPVTLIGQRHARFVIAQLRRHFVHLERSKVRRVRHDQIKAAFDPLEPVAGDDLGAFCHSVQNRIGTGLQTGRLAQINAKPLGVHPLRQERHEDTSRSRPEVQHTGKILGQRRLNQSLRLGARVQDITADLEAAAVELTLSDQVADRHADRAQGDQVVIAFGNFGRDILRRNERHPGRIHLCRMGQQQPRIPSRIRHARRPQPCSGRCHRLGGSHDPISAIMRACASAVSASITSFRSPCMI